MGYKAAFLIPKSSSRILSEHGWEFESNERVPEAILNSIVKKFGLLKEDEYEGVVHYRSDQMKITAIRDNQGLVEQVYFQLYSLSPSDLRNILDRSIQDFELFVP
jgi:hypothetical protein